MSDTVVLTASAGSFVGLADALREVPVNLRERPLLRFGAPLDWMPVDGALRRINTYEAVAFTSPRAATAIVERLDVLGLRWGAVAKRPKVWAAGPGTAEALRPMVGPVFLATGAGRDRLGAASALLGSMLRAKTKGPVLFPCGEVRRDELPAGLRQHGIAVEEVVCYRAILADEAEARSAVAGATVLVVASPSVVNLLLRALEETQRPELIAVGPTTAAAARNAGWPPVAIASEPDSTALAASITGLLANR
jgi:uroporphyrinogen-III synthase